MSRHLRLEGEPELRDAIAKIQEYRALAVQATNAKERAYYERMSLKWQGIADGWRTILEVDARSKKPSL
jgi:hypothetical protein